MSYTPYIFTDLVPDQNIRIYAGYATIALVSANFFLNVVIMIPSLVERSKTACRNCKTKISAKMS